MKIIEHKIYKDNRGSYTAFLTNTEGISWDQCSISTNDVQGTFRGLHYQTNPSQTKYIKVIKGAIIDFIVDLETKQTSNILLNSHTDQAILIPDNCAHGFLTLEPNTIVVYLVKGEYNPESEHSIIWDTIPEIKTIVENHTQNIIISKKDKNGK